MDLVSTGAAVTGPSHRRGDRAFEHIPGSGPGHHLDRSANALDRGEQRAAVLRPLEQMPRLPPGDAERDLLRTAVITEYIPYARHIAARYGVHGESAEDFRQAA